MGKVAVLGLGPSRELFEPYVAAQYEATIGVNDIWRFYKTDAIVCLDYPRAFTPDRMRVITESRPEAFYSQVVIWDTRPDFKKINIIPGYPEQACSIDGPDYQKSYCSPFVATQIAFKIYAAREIHLYGVDLTNHPHLDRKLCDKIKIHFSNLKRALELKDCKLIIHGDGILTNL